MQSTTLQSLKKIPIFLGLKALERDWLPDILIRKGIGHLNSERLKEDFSSNPQKRKQKTQKFLHQMRQSPIALVPETSKEQHYELPPAFFELVLGPKLKYSCALWDKAKNLAEAEEEMLSLYIDRAQIKNGQKILDLGCGWGSLSIKLAQSYPKCKIIAVSHSKDQKVFIESKIKKLNLKNLQVFTQDMNHFETQERFDRVVSIEMIEHMRNWEALLNKIYNWLKPEGLLFLHFFSHREMVYPFVARGAEDWMAKYFFSGGMMPCHDLPKLIQNPFKVVKDWKVSGVHYQKTAQAWFNNMDNRQADILKIFEKHYGKEASKKWWVYWRVFFMACEELWAYDHGREWMVSHYLLKKMK